MRDSGSPHSRWYVWPHRTVPPSSIAWVFSYFWWHWSKTNSNWPWRFKCLCIVTSTVQSHGQPVLNFLLVLLILDLYFLARIKIFNSEAEGLRIRLSEVIAFLFLFFYDGVEWFIKIILVFLVDVESIVIFWRDLYLVLHWLLVLIVGLVAFRQRGSLLFGLFVWGLHSYDYMNIYMFIGGLQDAYINLKWSITIGDCRIIFWLGIAAAPFCFLSRFSESRNTLPFCFCLCFCFLRWWKYPGVPLLTWSYFF